MYILLIVESKMKDLKFGIEITLLKLHMHAFALISRKYKFLLERIKIQ